MMRYPALENDAMSIRQKEIAEMLTFSETGGFVAKLQQALLHSPELAAKMAPLMDVLRYGLRLPEPLRAFAMFIAASKHQGNDAKRLLDMPDIRDSGLPQPVINSLIEGVLPEHLSGDQAMIYDYCMQLRTNGRVDNPTFAKVEARFGREVGLELVVLCGVTYFVSIIANVAEI